MIKQLSELKIIDWRREGNVVRIFLGKQAQNNWYGDDWDID